MSKRVDPQISSFVDPNRCFRQGEKIEVLQIDQLQSTVADYPDGQEFLTFGEMTIWIGNGEHPALGKLELKLFLMDRMEKVDDAIREYRSFQTVELRLCHLDPSSQPTRTTWNEGKTLNSTETILSARLFEEHCIIMALLDRLNSP